MGQDYRTAIGIVVMLAVVTAFTFIGWEDGYKEGVEAVNQELRAAGLKQYNPQTGKLEWTEKAGGNRE